MLTILFSSGSITIVAWLKYFFSWFNEIKKTRSDINDDSINKFFKFFLATKSKNFISPTSNIFKRELILSTIIN